TYAADNPLTGSDPNGLMRVYETGGGDGTASAKALDGTDSDNGSGTHHSGGGGNGGGGNSHHDCGWSFSCYGSKVTHKAYHVVQQHPVIAAVVATAVVVGVVACIAATAGGCGAVLVAAAEGFAAGAEMGSLSGAVVGASVGAIGEGGAVVAGAAGIAGAGAGAVAKGTETAAASKAATRSGAKAADTTAEGTAAAGAARSGQRAETAAPRSGAANCNHSFLPTTKVLMADGHEKQIKDVKQGDKVLATDPETGKSQSRPVDKLITTKDDKDFATVTIRDRGKTSKIMATVTHPFWVDSAHAWIDAGHLEAGMALHKASGATALISAVQIWHRPHLTHDLTVSVTHTYYVVAGQTPVLVHNCGRGAADLGHLTDRADDLHSLIPSGGQRYRTTGVLHADGVGGGIDLSAVGARSNLTLVQRADSLDAGELAISMSSGVHAEVKLVTAAQHLGLNPGGIATSRPFCPACSQFLANQGATLVSPRTALWLPSGVR
ncbi:polymorphic toxin-type HINT domain-containing protein, partial [Streptomyces sp. NPDC088747]|uniref:polymorphic toxin-type HINT domain-containing protein n=1 Tax=Streptomyces sp. NPDC088747 TaxID=3365886 RepID=UPI00382E9173